MALPQAPGDSLLTSFHPPGAAGGIAGGIAGGESSEVDPQSAFTTKQTAAVSMVHTVRAYNSNLILFNPLFLCSQ